MRPKRIISLGFSGLIALTCFLSTAWSVAKDVANLEAELAQLLKVSRPEDLSVATTLNALANLYVGKGRYAEAEPLYKRSLAIREKKLGPNHLDVAGSLRNLALLYQDERRYAEAEPLYKRSLAIREKRLGPNHPDVSVSLDNLASLYRDQGRFQEAEPLYKGSLAIDEKQYGPDHLEFAGSLDNLANIYREQGRSADAEPLYKRALTIRENRLGHDHADVAGSLNNLANVYQDQGRYGEAEALHKSALAIREKQLGPDHLDLAASLNNLANVYRDQGRYEDAEPRYLRGLVIREKQLGPNHLDVAASLNNLALLYQDQGRYGEAESSYQRALAIDQKHLGLDHPNEAGYFNNLAGLYKVQGRLNDAELMVKRSLAISEKQFGPDHPVVARSLCNLAGLFQEQKSYGEAESSYRRALGILEKYLGPNHPDVARCLSNLGWLYQDQGRYREAEPCYKRSLGIAEKQLGFSHPHVAETLNNLAALYLLEKRYGEAEPLFERSLAIFELHLGPDHPNVAMNLSNLAGLNEDQGRLAAAVPFSHRMFQIYRKRANTGDTDSNGSQSERQGYKSRLVAHVKLLSSAVRQSPVPKADLSNEAFEAGQLAKVSSTGEIVSKMAARFAAGSDALAQIVRKQQAALVRLHVLEADLLKKVGLDPDKRTPLIEQRLRQDIAVFSEQLTRLNKTLATDFPQYAELTSPRPLSLPDVQKLLRPQEALLAYTVGDTESYLFVLRPDKAELVRIAFGQEAIASSVQLLRQRLSQEIQHLDQLRPFDVQESNDLYQKVFAPAEPYLSGATNVMLVLDGPLQSLPFGVLVSELPKEEITKPEDYKKVAWLAKRYAFTTLPSVSSLKALRVFAKSQPGNQSFAGFGDPLLDGQVGKDKNIKLSSIFSTRSVADVDSIRKAPRLPDTADELKSIAKILKSPEGQLFLQDRATETNVKQTDLSNFKVIAFSTHGVMAGELKGAAEPGLILTPPRQATDLDDGYLSASEISQLKLNADWVLLSACNTAAPDGAVGAEGLSGLAKAFFYAGARSLLVSHWSVDSEATKELVTTLLQEYERNPDAGKAEALRKASLSVMNSPRKSYFSHPRFWAPFVVAGEGGSR